MREINRSLKYQAPVMLSVTAINMLVPITVFPLIARFAGTAEWGQFAIGQTVGAILGAVVAFSWPISGVQKVAEEQGSSFEILKLSLLMRGAVAVPAVLVAVALCLLMPSSRNLLSVVSAVTFCLVSGATSAWFFTGTGRPTGILIYATLPNAAAAVISAPLLIVTSDAVVYPIVLVSCSAIAVTLMVRNEQKKRDPAGGSVRPGALRSYVPEISRVVRKEWPLCGSEVVATVALGAPILVAGLLLAEEDVGLYAAGDKLFRAAIAFMVGLAAVVQAWFWSGNAANRNARLSRVLLVSGVGGAIGCLAIWVGLGPVVAILFGEQIRIPQLLSATLGVAFFLTTFSTMLVRLVILPSGRLGVIFVAKSVGAAMSYGSAYCFALNIGVAGVGVGVAAGEFVILLLLLGRWFTLGRSARC